MKAAEAGILKAVIETKLLQRALLFSVILAAGLLIGIFPLRKKISGAARQLKEMEARVMRAEETISNMEQFSQTLNERREELKKLSEMTFKPGEQAKVISLLTQATTELGISILNIKPAEAKQSPSSKRIEPSLFELEIECPYKTLGAFFEALEGAPLFLSVKSFESKPQASNQESLRTNMTLVAYEEWIRG